MGLQGQKSKTILVYRQWDYWKALYARYKSAEYKKPQ